MVEADGNPVTYKLETNCLYNAEGSAKVTWGETVIYAGVKFEIRTPWPDRPTQGSLMCGAELRPVAGRKYEPGPPSPESIELEELLTVELESLVVLTWIHYVSYLVRKFWEL